MMHKDKALSVTKTKVEMNPNLYLGVSMAVALIASMMYHAAISGIFA